MIRSIHAVAMAVAVGVAVYTAPVAEAAVVSTASSGSAIVKAVAPMPSANGQPQSATQMLHLAQRRGGARRGGFRRGRGGYRRGGRRRGGYRGRRRRGGGWVGPAIGAGIAAVIIGGAIASSKADHRDRWERCDDDFRTFRWSDGTYIPYRDSPRVLCPYLRR